MIKFGKPYGEGPHYITPDGVAVTMYRSGQRVRFFDEEGNQVGPELSNVVPAIVYAGWHRWLDPRSPCLSVAVAAEVRRNATKV